jgi:hypothetical protein
MASESPMYPITTSLSEILLKLYKKKADIFHHIGAQCLFFCYRTHHDIQTAVLFIFHVDQGLQ